MEFSRKDNTFKLEYINSDVYRVLHLKSRTWGIIKASDENSALLEAESIIDTIFADGNPNFYPNAGDKFIVTSDNGLIFLAGAHIRNTNGSGRVFADKGDVITFDREGEDNGFWYLDMGRNVHPDHYFKYDDGSVREDVKGSKPWQLLWRMHIKKVS